MNIHSTATKDCYGLFAAHSRKTILNCYEGDDRLQRILLSPLDRRPAIHTEVVSSDLERVQTRLNQMLLMRLLPAFPVDDGTAHRLMSYVQDTYEHVLSLTPHPSRGSVLNRVHTYTGLPTAGHAVEVMTW